MKTHKTINGQPVTDEQIIVWADAAESGYDVATLKKRGRPRIGSDIAQVTAIRLDPELAAALDERAKHDQESRSDVMRDALRAWLHTA